MLTDTYKVQTRAQAKAQANAPTAVDTQPIAQKATPKVTNYQAKQKKRITSKDFPVELSNNLQNALHCPQKLYFPLLLNPQISGCHQSCQMSKKLLQAQI